MCIACPILMLLVIGGLAVAYVILSKKTSNDFIEQLGDAFYLPGTDIDDPPTNGIKIFKPFPYKCFKEVPKIRKTQEFEREYSHLKEFYGSIAADAGVDSKVTGKFTMGLTLSIKTSHLFLRSIDVKGSSIEIATHVKEVFLDENCYKTDLFNFLTIS